MMIELNILDKIAPPTLNQMIESSFSFSLLNILYPLFFFFVNQPMVKVSFYIVKKFMNESEKDNRCGFG